MLDNKALRSFVAVAKSGSIRGGAELLAIAPSAVSRHVAELEYQLGVPLLDRSTTGVSLTESGEFVLEHARRILTDLQLLDEQIARLKSIDVATVHTACGEGFVADFVGTGLQAFKATNPAIRHVVTTGSTEAITAAVIAGEADVGIVYNPIEDARIRVLAMARQPLCVVAPHGHEILDRAPVALADCVDLPCAMLSKGHGIRQLLGQVTLASGRPIVPVLETRSIDALRQFVVAGMGVTFLPRFAVSHEAMAGTVGLRELDDPLLSQANAHLMVRAHRRLPGSVAALIETLAATMSAFIPSDRPARTGPFA
ncbi:LysR family transcriptional regulator [Jiella sp. CQZ9-1]|uniref:LysR family transcriptional regulator n=2 Tax=Jiella flava TaxID=2816857 RepID=A0A939FW39_9HYPH|nr:LysR family transcriptional regulator [Jiella flava]